MIKSIISKLVILLIIVFAGISIFWFFKTSALKKSVLSAIAASEGEISASSVSVGGFPFRQKLKIHDLKLQFSALDNLPDQTLSKLPSNVIPDNKYQVQIRKFESLSMVFSNNFVVSTLEDVSVRNRNGTVNSIQFNQKPIITFSVSRGTLSKFSYQDFGYKILDAGKNILFENGDSTISFVSTEEGNKYRGKITAHFKDVGDLSFSHDMSTPKIAAQQESVVDNSQQVIDPAINPETAIAPEAPKEVVPAEPTANLANNLVKKSFTLDLEFVSSKAPLPSPSDNVDDQLVPIVASNEQTIELIDIKNFEILSPLYKVNIYGQINNLAKGESPIINISVKIEKLDNILTYIKRSIVNIPDNTNANKIGDVLDTATESSEPVIDNEIVSSPAVSTQKPEADILGIIRTLSRKNAATNSEVAMFEFRQEKDKDLLINETSVADIINQIFNPVVPESPPVVTPATEVPAVVAPTTPETPTVQEVPAITTPVIQEVPNGTVTTPNRTVTPAEPTTPATPTAPTEPATEAPATTAPATTPETVPATTSTPETPAPAAPVPSENPAPTQQENVN